MDWFCMQTYVLNFLLSTSLNYIMYSYLCIVCSLQVAASASDVEKTLNLPASPRLMG